MRTYKKAVLPLISLVVTCCLTAETTKVTLDSGTSFTTTAELIADPEGDLRLLFLRQELLDRLNASDSILIVMRRMTGGDLYYFHKLSDKQIKIEVMMRQLMEIFDLKIHRGFPTLTYVARKSIRTYHPSQFLKDPGSFGPGGIVIMTNIGMGKEP